MCVCYSPAFVPLCRVQQYFCGNTPPFFSFSLLSMCLDSSIFLHSWFLAPRWERGGRPQEKEKIVGAHISNSVCLSSLTDTPHVWWFRKPLNFALCPHPNVWGPQLELFRKAPLWIPRPFSHGCPTLEGIFSPPLRALLK